MAANLDSIEKVLSDIKIEVNNITSNSNSANGNSAQNVIDYTILLNDISTSNNSLKANVSRISGFMPDISHYLKDSTKYLKDIESHIKGFSNGQSNPKNTTGSSTNFSNIETTVKSILDEIKQFRIDYNTTQYNKNYSNLTKNQQKIEDQHRNLEYASKKRENERRILEEKLRNNPSDKKALKDLQDLNKQEIKYKKALKKSEITDPEKRISNIANIAAGGIKNIALDKPNASKMIDDGISKISQAGGWGAAIGAILTIIKTGFDVYNKQQRLGSDYARSFGGGKGGMNIFQNQGIGFVNRNLHFGLNANNYGLDEFSSAITEATESIGRSALYLSDRNIKGIADLQRFKLNGSLNIFDTFGKNGGDVADYFKNAMGSSGRKGLSFKNVSKAVKDNLKMAQSYTFSSGLNGLIKMAEKSTQLKFNMTEVSKAAEKVSTLEGAIKAGAGLSVLGGEFANFANPMQMLYEGLNDIEGLQDRIINMFGNMAYFDKSKQQIDITAFDKQRIKAASEAMGVDYGEMLNLAMNNHRGRMVEKQLGRGLDEETAEYIKNIAQIDKNGNAYVNLNGNELAVSALTEGNKNELKRQSELQDVSKKATLGDVFVETKTIYDKLDELLKYIQEKLGVWVSKIAGFNEFGGNNAAEELWDNINHKDNEIYQKLLKKYGNESAAKTALGNGSEEKLLNDFYGGEEYRKFYDYKWGNGGNGSSDYRAAKRIHENKMTIEEKQEFEAWKKSQRQSAIGENYIYGKPHQLGGELRNVEGGEAILNRTAVNGLGISNISKFNHGNFTPISNVGNTLNSLKVNPSYNSSVSPQKISFEPININLNGKFELSSNGKNKSINLDELDKNELKRLVMDIVKSSTPQINRQLMTLHDKGYNMALDPFRGSGGYA